MIYFIGAVGSLAFGALFLWWWWYGTMGDVALVIPVGAVTIAAIVLAVFLVMGGAGVA